MLRQLQQSIPAQTCLLVVPTKQSLSGCMLETWLGLLWYTESESRSQKMQSLRWHEVFCTPKKGQRRTMCCSLRSLVSVICIRYAEVNIWECGWRLWIHLSLTPTRCKKGLCTKVLCLACRCVFISPQNISASSLRFLSALETWYVFQPLSKNNMHAPDESASVLCTLITTRTFLTKLLL